MMIGSSDDVRIESKPNNNNNNNNIPEMMICDDDDDDVYENLLQNLFALTFIFFMTFFLLLVPIPLCLSLSLFKSNRFDVLFSNKYSFEILFEMKCLIWEQREQKKKKKNQIKLNQNQNSDKGKKRGGKHGC